MRRCDRRLRRSRASRSQETSAVRPGGIGCAGLTTLTGSFFFPAEDGIRDATVTGVQTCALPISVARLTGAALPGKPLDGVDIWPLLSGRQQDVTREVFLYFNDAYLQAARLGPWKLHIARYSRSEERRVGKEWREAEGCGDSRKRL